jgi:hypothetical protein
LKLNPLRARERNSNPLEQVDGLGLDHNLLVTLERLGVSAESRDRGNWTVLSHADPEFEMMSNTYAVLNRDLLQIVSRTGIPISHITGEARVLVDPAHRTVIRKNATKDTVTQLACRPEKGDIVDASSFISAQRHRWSTLTWTDLIDIISLCASSSVRVSVLKQPAMIHYSIFGTDRILLQSEHDHPSDKKEVWYMHASEVAGELATPTIELIEAAEVIPATSFACLLQWLFSEAIFPIFEARGVISQQTMGRLNEEDLARLLNLGVLRQSDDDGLEFESNLAPDLQALETFAAQRDG